METCCPGRDALRNPCVTYTLSADDGARLGIWKRTACGPVPTLSSGTGVPGTQNFNQYPHARRQDKCNAMNERKPDIPYDPTSNKKII